MEVSSAGPHLKDSSLRHPSHPPREASGANTSALSLQSADTLQDEVMCEVLSTAPSHRTELSAASLLFTGKLERVG